MAKYTKKPAEAEMIAIKKILLFLAALALTASTAPDLNLAEAASSTIYTVKPGDSMWKICVRYEVGLSELIAANPQVKNPAWIYPGEKLTVPLNTGVQTIENQVIQLVNQERQKRGLPAFVRNWELCRVARFKSQDMRDRGYFSHTSPTYGSPFTMIRNFGLSFTAAGENIAAGQPTATEVMRSWMNSPGHRQNILNKGFTQIGVGYAQGGSYRYYWTEEFIHP